MTDLEREAGEPYYTFKRVHEDFYKRLQTDERLTTEYRVDSWGQGKFNIMHLPPTGVHGRYQRVNAVKVEESTSFYTYRLEVIVWLFINQQFEVDRQYDLAELYLSRVNQIFTEKPDDWSLDGTVNIIEFVRADYAQDWSDRQTSILLCATTFNIYVDIMREHT
jgi:hypothetical protein